MSGTRRIGMLSGLSRLARAMFAPTESLSAAESASDLYRFFRSKHVIDLKVIAFVAFLAGAAYLGYLVVTAGENGLETAIASNAAILAGCAAAIGWAYRSASAKLGVVDLFACEISTLCRVGTIFDSARRYISWYEIGRHGQPWTTCEKAKVPAKFVSQEEYFPILASNASDLQLLQAEVVSHIVEFYTYMKGVRDQLRGLAALNPMSADNGHCDNEPDKWHAMVFNLVYSILLGYESARKAIKDLIEFEPAAAESTIVMLLTEVRCYAFLVEKMPLKDFRYDRFCLREDDYGKEVLPLCQRVRDQRGTKHEKDWHPALALVAELERRYHEEYVPAARNAKRQRPNNPYTVTRSPELADVS